jgi:hypothetical protein
VSKDKILVFIDGILVFKVQILVFIDGILVGGPWFVVGGSWVRSFELRDPESKNTLTPIRVSALNPRSAIPNPKWDCPS